MTVKSFPYIHYNRKRQPALIGITGLLIGLVTICRLASCPLNAATFVPPLKVSSNKRYLVDQNNRPFLLTADTAWTLLSRVADRAEVRAYLDARKAQGFNTIMSGMTTWEARSASRGGVAAFHHGDLTQPNDAYFAFIDNIVQDAADRGLILMLNPVWLASNGVRDAGGTPSIEEWKRFGTYVGNRYRHFDNIIWFVGGDHGFIDPWSEPTDYSEGQDAIAKAIKAADSRHVMTYHPSLDTFIMGDRGWLDFYSYQENRADSAPWQYQRTKSYRDCSPVHPGLSIEPGYETGDALTKTATTSYMVRRNAWWSMLSGAMGVAYGGPRAVWFIGENGPNRWRNAVNLGGAKGTAHIRTILEHFAWYKLVPTDGAGRDRHHISEAFADDASLYVGYTPDGGSLTVDTAKLGSSATAEWYDPSTGKRKQSAAKISGGLQHFSNPGRNGDGNEDWVLVIHTPSGMAN